MALENPLFVKRAVNARLANNVPDGSFLREQVENFFRRWTQQAGNGLLEVHHFSDADSGGTSGVVLQASAATVYAVVVWKSGTNATDTYLKLYNDTTNDSTAADVRVVVPVLDADEGAVAFFPQGIRLGTGVVATAHTTATGTTDSGTAGNAPQGFVIVGA